MYGNGESCCLLTEHIELFNGTDQIEEEEEEEFYCFVMFLNKVSPSSRPIAAVKIKLRR